MARDLTEDEIDYCTSATCKYILNQAVKKQYIKTSDITKHCLKGEQRHYETVFQNAKSLLSEVYGLSIKTVKDPKLGKVYLCISKIESASKYEYTEKQRKNLKLLFIVLSYVYMKGDAVLESTLFGILRKFGVDSTENEYFGKYETMISENFVKQLYLKREKVIMEAGNNEDCFQYSWGPRASLEFPKAKILETVAKLLDKPENVFLKQYEDVHGGNESVEEPMEIP